MKLYISSRDLFSKNYSFLKNNDETVAVYDIDNNQPYQYLKPCPVEYKETLKLLIEADQSGFLSYVQLVNGYASSGNWPTTTVARQRVINSDTENNSEGGSFSIGRPGSYHIS